MTAAEILEEYEDTILTLRELRKFDEATKNRLYEKIVELEGWKKEQMQVLSDLRLQEIGRALWLPLGTHIAREILPAITRMGGQLDALLEHCSKEGGECSECSRIICPHGDPFHFHHDGCPSCL